MDGERRRSPRLRRPGGRVAHRTEALELTAQQAGSAERARVRPGRVVRGGSVLPSRGRVAIRCFLGGSRAAFTSPVSDPFWLRIPLREPREEGDGPPVVHPHRPGPVRHEGGKGVSCRRSRNAKRERIRESSEARTSRWGWTAAKPAARSRALRSRSGRSRCRARASTDSRLGFDRPVSRKLTCRGERSARWASFSWVMFLCVGRLRRSRPKEMAPSSSATGDPVARGRPRPEGGPEECAGPVAFPITSREMVLLSGFPIS